MNNIRVIFRTYFKNRKKRSGKLLDVNLLGVTILRVKTVGGINIAERTNDQLLLLVVTL